MFKELVLALDTVAVSQRCIKNWMNVSQGFVTQIMKDLDPVGVDTRRGRALRRCLYYGKSPNRVWHLDSYDKFKPFGFESKRCIDGDSRCILWEELFIREA